MIRRLASEAALAAGMACLIGVLACGAVHAKLRGAW